MATTLSSAGLKHLEEIEGREHRAYKDSGGAWTIGIGHLVKPDEMSKYVGTPTRIDGKWRGSIVLSDAEVDALCRADVAWAAQSVQESVRVSQTTNQKDSLISFAFNVGEGAFERSTLLKKINAGAPANEITAEFMRWDNDNGREVPGLVVRRTKEARLYWSHLTATVVLFLCLAAVLCIATGTLLIA